MKKIFSLFVSLLAVITLVSCGNSDQKKPDNNGVGSILEQSQSAKSAKFVSADYPAPTKAPEGMKFFGWFRNSIGQSVFEPNALKDGDYINPQGKIFPYFVPQDYRTFNWPKGSTNYNAGIQAHYQNPLNPFTVKENAITNIIDATTLQLFRVVPNWRKAIKDGFASYVNDFSKFKDGSASFNKVDRLYVLDGLASFPKNQQGQEFLNEYGEFDINKAADVTDTKWSFELRNDLKFYGTNTPINAETYEYALKTALDPKQGNLLGLRFYKDKDNANGHAILNGKQYLKGQTTWDKVGFHLDPTDPYRFVIEFDQPVSQLEALGTASEFYIVEKSVYENSLNSDKTRSSYGTTVDLYSNSGNYILKEFNNKSRLVLNKNFGGRLAYLSSYNSMVTTLVNDENARLTEFVQGNSTAIGVSAVNKDKLSKWQDTTIDLNGDSARLMIFNTTKTQAKVDKVESDPIIGKKEFRRALLFAVNRVELAKTAGFPGQPVAIPVSNDDVEYVTNNTSYAKSQYHKDILKKYGLDATNPGFAPDKAKELLKKAYSDMGYPDDKVISLVVVRPDADLWKLTYQQIEKNINDVFNGKIKLIDRPLSGKASDEATKTYNWDLLLTGLSANTYYNILWQLATINFGGAYAGASELGINNPIDNYSSLPADANGNRLAEFTKNEYTINIPKAYEYLKEKFENPESNYYNEDGSVKSTYALNKEIYDIIKPTKGLNVKVDYLTLVNTLVYNDEAVYQPVSNYPRVEGLEEEAYQLTQIFDDLFFDYVPSMGLYTNAGKVAYKPYVGNLWPTNTLRWEWGPGSYRFLTTAINYAEFYNENAKDVVDKILEATKPSQLEVNLTLPNGITATSLDKHAASIDGAKLTSFLGNTARLLFISTDPFKSVYEIQYNGKTIKALQPNQFIFKVDNVGEIKVISSDTTYHLNNLPEGLTASQETVKYNEPVTINIAIPQGAEFYRLTLGSDDLTSQVVVDSVTAAHIDIANLTQEPSFQVTFITEIQISSDWTPVISSKVLDKGGKKYIEYNSVVAFNRVIPASESNKDYYESINGTRVPSDQLLVKYEYDKPSKDKLVIKELLLTLIVKGAFDTAIVVTDENPVDINAILTKSKDYTVEFKTPTSNYKAVDATNPTAEFNAADLGSKVFVEVGSEVKFTVTPDPNLTLTKVSYNGSDLSAVDGVYTIASIVANAEITITTVESEAHKTLVSETTKLSTSTIVAKEKSRAGIIKAIREILGDTDDKNYKYDISFEVEVRGQANVTITSNSTHAYVTYDNIPYQFQ